jgi:F-type H+-transporting ATPase subunit epsilon
MDAATVLLEVVTPKGVAFREPVLEVTVPGTDGELGVLPGHVPLIAAIRTGLVTYRLAGRSQPARFVVHHGFCEVADDKALLLAERVMQPADVDVVAVRARLKEVDAALGHWDGDLSDPKRRELIEEEQWLASQLEVIGDPPLPTVREDTRFFPERAEPATASDIADPPASEDA